MSIDINGAARRPAGTPGGTGGQFSAQHHTAPAGSLAVVEPTAEEEAAYEDFLVEQESAAEDRSFAAFEAGEPASIVHAMWGGDPAGAPF